jgi:hypothetical protein
MAAIPIAFFFVFEKKKMTIMRNRLFLWRCCSEEDNNNLLSSFFSMFEKKNDALLSPLLDPFENTSMLNCGKLELGGCSRLPTLKRVRGAC